MLKTQKAIEFYSENKIEKKDSPKPLLEFEKTIFSQYGEDGILEEIFNRIKTENKYYIEFGAGDGFYLSNTANLRVNEGWNGVLFEGNEKLIQNTNRDELNLHNELIFSDNVNDIFDKYNVPKNIGLLSVDVDGDDAYIIQSINFEKFSPDVIICEFNPGLPNHKGIKIIEQKNNLSDSDLHSRGYVGCNIRELYNILTPKGYKFVTSISVNCFFVKEEYFKLLNISDLEKDEIMSIHSYSDGYSSWKSQIIYYNDSWVVEN
jgi:hypothetical protein